MPEEEKKIEKEEPKEYRNAFFELPMYIKAGGAAVALLFFYEYQSTGNQNYLYGMIGTLVVMWILGRSMIRPDLGILKPYEAELEIEKELKRKLRWDQIHKGVTWRIGPYNGLKYHNALPQFYLYPVTIRGQNFGINNLQAQVFAVGKEKGIVTFQKADYEITGKETVPTRDIIDKLTKRSHQEGWDKYRANMERSGGVL